MGGTGSMRFVAHSSNYTNYGNSAYVQNSGCKWVKLWISWWDLQQNYQPPDQPSSWNQLNNQTNAYGQIMIRQLDAQIRTANQQGIAVILTVNHGYPTWSNGSNNQGDPNSGKGPERKFPTNLANDSPLGWFMSYLYARYRPQAPSSTPPGNPDGAYVNAIEPCNEPNSLGWPQSDAVCTAASMMEIAETYSTYWNLNGIPCVLGPATSDVDGSNSVQTDYLTFTDNMLDSLSQWRPRVYVGWSHHNYRDINKDVNGGQASVTRLNNVWNSLNSKNWRGGGDRYIFVTEGGYNVNQAGGTDDKQNQYVRDAFNLGAIFPAIYMFTQHIIYNEASNTFQSGVAKNFTYPPPAATWQTRPLYNTWLGLPGYPNP